MRLILVSSTLSMYNDNWRWQLQTKGQDQEHRRELCRASRRHSRQTLFSLLYCRSQPDILCKKEYVFGILTQSWYLHCCLTFQQGFELLQLLLVWHLFELYITYTSSTSGRIRHCVIVPLVCSANFFRETRPSFWFSTIVSPWWSSCRCRAGSPTPFQNWMAVEKLPCISVAAITSWKGDFHAQTCAGTFSKFSGRASLAFSFPNHATIVFIKLSIHPCIGAYSGFDSFF